MQKVFAPSRRALLGGILAAAAVPAPTFGQSGSRHSYVFDGDAHSTGWLPFEFPREALIELAGTVADRPARIWLDSGVSGLILDGGFADRLGLAAGASVRARTVDGSATGSRLPPQSVRIGNLAITTDDVSRFDFAALREASGLAVDVMLGRDLFEQVVVDIDFSGRRLAAHRPAARYPLPSGARAVPLRPAGRLRVLPVAVEGRPLVPASFDLGFNGALMLSPAYAARERLLEGRRTTSGMNSDVQGVAQTTELILPRLDFGGLAFRDVPVSVPESWALGPLAAVAGTALLSRFRLVTNYGRDAMLVLPAADAATREFRRDRSGRRTLPRGDRLRVLHVSRGSPAEAAGWRAGEEIVAVDDARVGSPVFASRPFWAKGPAGTTLTFTLADGRRRRLTLADYF